MTSFKSRMARVKWMDKATRATALDKADAVVHKIGYPDFVANPTELDQHYEQVPLILDVNVPCVGSGAL